MYGFGEPGMSRLDVTEMRREESRHPHQPDGTCGGVPQPLRLMMMMMMMMMMMKGLSAWAHACLNPHPCGGTCYLLN